jgi:hypothetical protein
MENLKGNTLTLYALAIRQTFNKEINPKNLKDHDKFYREVNSISSTITILELLINTENPFSKN